MTDVTVVIPHYFAPRWANLPSIVDALQRGTVTPAEILVWNNEPQHGEVPPGVQVIQAHRNMGAKARFIAALLARSPCVLFHDNDLRVQPRTLENMLRHADADGRRGVYSLHGRRLEGRAYRDALRVRAHTVSRPTAVDVSLGRLELVTKDIVARLLPAIPFDDTTVMDDVWFSAVAARHGITRWVVPQGADDAGYVDLSEYDMGSFVSDPERHMAQRDVLCGALFSTVSNVDDDRGWGV